MRRTHRGDARRVTGCGKPIVNGRADRAACMGPLGFGPGRPAGDQQQCAIAARNRMFQPEIEALIGRIEIMAMKIDRALRCDQAARKSAVPAGIERRVGNADELGCRNCALAARDRR